MLTTEPIIHREGQRCSHFNGTAIGKVGRETTGIPWTSEAQREEANTHRDPAFRPTLLSMLRGPGASLGSHVAHGALGTNCFIEVQKNTLPGFGANHLTSVFL